MICQAGFCRMSSKGPLAFWTSPPAFFFYEISTKKYSLYDGTTSVLRTCRIAVYGHPFAKKKTFNIFPTCHLCTHFFIQTRLRSPGETNMRNETTQNKRIKVFYKKCAIA